MLCVFKIDPNCPARGKAIQKQFKIFRIRDNDVAPTYLASSEVQNIIKSCGEKTAS